MNTDEIIEKQREERLNCINAIVKSKSKNKLILAGACQNHSKNTDPVKVSESSARRLKRLTELVGNNEWEGVHPPDDLIAILADDRVEQRGGNYITVEAAVACPAEKIIWYTLGGYPAASRGNWVRIEWPW